MNNCAIASHPIAYASKSKTRWMVCPTKTHRKSSWTEYTETDTEIYTYTETDEDTSKSKVEAEQPSEALDINRDDIITIATIRELAECKDGWKGEGSVAASKEVIKDAETFTYTIFEIENMERPFVGLDADGDITFFWKTDKVILDLSIYGDGTYSFFAKSNSGTCFRGDAVSVNKNFSTELTELLKK